ncbi:MAG: BON domain-containing protein [Desulfobulbaceae bacterium]|nr:BON domain-containing protein [Desulfobulbaceae bacterium]
MEEALVEDPAADAYEIATSVSDGVVRLAGTVDSWTEKMLAEEVADRVKGVKGVKSDQVVVDIKTRRPDPEITQDVKQALAIDEYVDDALINVPVNDGIASLDGSVDSWSEFKAAVNNSFEGGAKSVKTHLTVQGLEPLSQTYYFPFDHYYTPF